MGHVAHPKKKGGDRAPPFPFTCVGRLERDDQRSADGARGAIVDEGARRRGQATAERTDVEFIKQVRHVELNKGLFQAQIGQVVAQMQW